LYPALSSIAKIKNIARKAKFIVRKLGKFDKVLYVCGVMQLYPEGNTSQQTSRVDN